MAKKNSPRTLSPESAAKRASEATAAAEYEMPEWLKAKIRANPEVIRGLMNRTD